MAETKTKPTGASIEAYFDARANPQQRSDCQVLVELMQRVTQEPPHMWGPSIVGFGSYRYTYASGHSGEAPLAGFAVRGRELVVYVDVESKAQQALLAKVGKHKIGKVCLYFKRLADLDLETLEKLVEGSVEQVRRRHSERPAPVAFAD